MPKQNWRKTACILGALLAATAIAAPAQTFTALYSFRFADGESPEAALVQATDGKLYGTAIDGGAGDYGTVFKITPQGALTRLHSFNNRDSANPFSALIQAADGNFYGTASSGGANDHGTVFKITVSGTVTNFHNFDGADGAYPTAALVQAADGNFYGTTFEGGLSSACNLGFVVGCGTVFKITPGGTLTTLHSFDSTDGALPGVPLIQANDGNFYGTASEGGSSGACNIGFVIGCGTVFKITPKGTLTTLHSFDGTDGGGPAGALVLGSDGNFYGTASSGGANGDGTVFKITPSGTLTTLHSFDGADGESPTQLIQATDGNLYGTTTFGGANNLGTLFKITPGGTLTTLISFCLLADCTDGELPAAGLVQDTDGTFYGITSGGGTYGDGTVFSLGLGLGPFVETQPAYGKVGSAIRILGTNLTGARSVTFNGVPAIFTVQSATLIKATVPFGATTGPIQVVAPSGTLSSNVNFRVEP